VPNIKEGEAEVQFQHLLDMEEPKEEHVGQSTSRSASLCRNKSVTQCRNNNVGLCKSSSVILLMSSSAIL